MSVRDDGATEQTSACPGLDPGTRKANARGQSVFDCTLGSLYMSLAQDSYPVYSRNMRVNVTGLYNVPFMPLPESSVIWGPIKLTECAGNGFIVSFS